jgi:RimJ/RimL family protein N-acetyltransferase
MRTARLDLRAFELSDVDRLVELDGDPDVMRFINGGRATPRPVIVERTLPMLMTYDRHGLGSWAAEVSATGAFIGWFGLRPTGNPGEAELGYRLRRAAWGHGYATEGARALIAVGFAEMGVQRITANTMTVNTASRRVMEKAGLTYVRTYHLQWPETIPGTEAGDVEYALVRADWTG